MVDSKAKHDDAIATMHLRAPSAITFFYTFEIHIMVGSYGDRDIVSKFVTRNIGSVFSIVRAITNVCCVVGHIMLLLMFK